MSEPIGVTPEVPTYRCLRDETIELAGQPFKRLLVYRLEIPLPLPPEGVSVFGVQEDFTIVSITASSSVQFRSDADYLVQDVADGETVGVVEVRAGKKGLFPMAVPDLPAGLGGPCRILFRPRQGPQATSGALILQIGVNGPPIVQSGVDENQDGVPDELGEEVLPLPPVHLESFDDFYEGYAAGIQGIDRQ